MSFRWMRTATIAKGHFMEAIAWGKEMAGFVEKKFNTGKCDVWLDTFGPVGTIRWSIDVPDLATIERVQGQILMDQEYWKMIDKAMKNELFVDNATVDHMLKKV
jgi:hypothetical protein